MPNPQAIPNRRPSSPVGDPVRTWAQSSNALLEIQRRLIENQGRLVVNWVDRRQAAFERAMTFAQDLNRATEPMAVSQVMRDVFSASIVRLQAETEVLSLELQRTFQLWEQALSHASTAAADDPAAGTGASL